jgi:hypothetical protein
MKMKLDMKMMVLNNNTTDALARPAAPQLAASVVNGEKQVNARDSSGLNYATLRSWERIKGIG